MWKQSHRFLTTVGSEDEISLVRDKDTRNPREIWNRMQILVGVGIDQVDRVVRCVGNIEGSGFIVDGGMVEAAFLLVCR